MSADDENTVPDFDHLLKLLLVGDSGAQCEAVEAPPHLSFVQALARAACSCDS